MDPMSSLKALIFQVAMPVALGATGYYVAGKLKGPAEKQLLGAGVGFALGLHVRTHLPATWTA